MIRLSTASPARLRLQYGQASKEDSDGCITCTPSFVNHPIFDHCPQAVSSPAPACPLLLQSLVCCCVVVRHLLLSLHAVVQLLTLFLPAAFATNRQPLPSGGLDTSRCLPLLLLLFVGCCVVVSSRFCHHTLPCDRQRSCFWPFLPPIVARCPQVVSSPATACLCCYRDLVGCCVAVVQP
jgi:hypothetical protein